MVEEEVEGEVQVEVRREAGAALVIEEEAILEVEGSVVGASAHPEEEGGIPILQDLDFEDGVHDANIWRYSFSHLEKYIPRKSAIQSVLIVRNVLMSTALM